MSKQVLLNDEWAIIGCSLVIFFILLGAILVTIIVLLLTGKDNSDTPIGVKRTELSRML